MSDLSVAFVCTPEDIGWPTMETMRPFRTKYFGVVSNREYLKVSGTKEPYWKFLDRMPDGWLSSLIYKTTEFSFPSNRGPLIYDCGAWSYRDEVTPEITPESALEQYLLITRPGDFIVAPDHMLIDGVDHDARRMWNLDSARRFIRLHHHGRVPMGVIHGQTIEERVSHAKFLMAQGYEALSVGGIAARASQKSLAVQIVSTLRSETKGRWLHVLGLSSPDYFRSWSELGVDSCDGSSHFKQAFTGGAFFTQHGPKLKKWMAGRLDNDHKTDAPKCECAACSGMRAEGIDTRFYGSNENNMGRAAHNMNMLMRAQLAATGPKVALVACSSQKLGRRAMARDLYTSPLFRKSREWVERNGYEWLILSAKHGVVHPTQMLSPYDMTLNEMSAAKRDEWGDKVASQLLAHRDSHFIALAGENYLSFQKHLRMGVETPMAGLGIGQRLAWLDAWDLQGSAQLNLIGDDK